MAKHTMDETYEAVLEVRDQLKVMNGTVRKNCIDIAVLQVRQSGDTSNWDKVWDILKPVLVAIIVAVVIRGMP